MEIRAFSPDDIPAMMGIWNSVVEEGIAFPQTETILIGLHIPVVAGPGLPGDEVNKIPFH